MAARLLVPAFGATLAQAREMRGTDTISVDVRVTKATLVRNNHLHADELHLSAEYLDCGVDPRLLKHATVYFYIEDSPEGEEIDVDASSTHILDQVTGETEQLPVLQPRFVGTAIKVHRAARSGDGFAVDMDFHDYTRFFIGSRPYPQSGVPEFNLTLRDAWRKICAHTGWYDKSTNKIVSSVEILADRLFFKASPDIAEALETLQVGKAVTGRLRTLGHPPAQHGESANAWDVWQHVCQMLGLLSYIDGDQCVVTTSTERYANTEAPVLIWGNNITDAEETVNVGVTDRGVCLQAFDPAEGKMLESFYPTPGDPRVYVKRSVAHKKTYNPNDVLPVSDQFDYFEMHGITNQTELDKQAKAAYEERARQEIEGTLKTAEMAIQRADGASVSVLDLKAGDTIQVKIGDDDLELLQNQFTNEADRLVYLLNKGYSIGSAELISHNLEALGSFDNNFHISQVQLDFEVEKFEVEIRYHNLINLRTALGSDTEEHGSVVEFAPDTIVGKRSDVVTFAPDTITANPP